MSERHLSTSRPTPGSSSSSPPLSRLAVIGLVVALVPFCPLTGLLGAFLGILAIRRIRLSDGRLGGQRVALAAIVVGAAASMVWSAGLDYFANRMRRQAESEMVAAVEWVLREASAGRPDEAVAVWVPREELIPAGPDVADFGARVVERYGPLTRFQIVSTARSGTFFVPAVEIAGIFHFRQGEPVGSARFESWMPGGSLMPVFKLTRITIEDPQRGDLTLGAPLAEEENPGPQPPEGTSVADPPASS